MRILGVSCTCHTHTIPQRVGEEAGMHLNTPPQHSTMCCAMLPVDLERSGTFRKRCSGCAARAGAAGLGCCSCCSCSSQPSQLKREPTLTPGRHAAGQGGWWTGEGKTESSLLLCAHVLTVYLPVDDRTPPPLPPSTHRLFHAESYPGGWRLGRTMVSRPNSTRFDSTLEMGALDRKVVTTCPYQHPDFSAPGPHRLHGCLHDPDDGTVTDARKGVRAPPSPGVE